MTWTPGLRRHLGLTAEVAGYLVWLLADLVLAEIEANRIGVVGGTVVAVLVLLRRRRGPVLAGAPALGASLLLTGFIVLTGPPASTDMSLAEQLALAVLVVAGLRTLPLGRAFALTAVAAAAIVGSALLRSGPDVGPFFGVLSALGWGGAVGIGLALRDAENGRRAALDEARSAERMELARELHDVVAHHVTGIIVAAQAAAVVARTSPDDVDRALATIETAGSDAMAAMRRMVGVLRGQDAAGQEAGGRTPGADLAGVESLVHGFDPDVRRTRLRTDPGLEHALLPAGVSATGYRVVQEALTNVRRHAPAATAVEVELGVRDDALLVSVHNDGVAATGPRGPRGFGLVGMAERVSALGGALTAGPAGPGTWTVAARLPLGGAR